MMARFSFGLTFLALLVGVMFGPVVTGEPSALDDLRHPVPPEETPPAEAVPAPSDPAPPTATVAEPPPPVIGTPSDPALVYIVPLHDAVSEPNEFILRRAAKEAIAAQADVFIIDLDTPGGASNNMLEIMEQVHAFQGLTIAYVDDEAMSAGAFIAFSADEIWYAPGAVIGSAAMILATGEDVPETLGKKLQSYINAKARAMAASHPYRTDVIRAMAEEDFVLEIDGEVIKPAGELLALTADEALKTYGHPPTALFGNGKATSIDDLLTQRFGEGNYKAVRFEVSWSEELGKYLNDIAPAFMGLGILLLFIEFKTPGFGFIGIAGLVLIGLFFASSYVTGLAGHEPLIVFVVGLLLILADIILLPGTFVLGTLGLILLLGAMFWSFLDAWPTGDGTGISMPDGSLADAFARTVWTVALAMIFAVAFWRFLPKAISRRLVLASGEETAAVTSTSSRPLPDLGSTGLVIRDLRPAGEVEVNGHRYAASAPVGSLPRGTRVKVVAYRDFGLLVEKEGP